MDSLTRRAKKFLERKRAQEAEKIGQWIEFDSPLFGRCTGKVVALEGDVYTITEHSVLKERTKIQVVWIQGEND